jgi:hypothetical protein
MVRPFESFRELFSLMLDRRRHRMPIYWHSIAPWVDSHPGERHWLEMFGRRRGRPIPPAEMTELWSLYALSRVNDLLLLNFQQGPSAKRFPDPRISLQEYLLFAESLALNSVDQPSFSSFYHEIVEVDEAPNDSQSVTLEEVLWPCLMLGDMMFSRAGVRVSGGRRHISKQLGESSTLYWTYRRKNRRCLDLSHGWGSNSQWGTDFRRDYRIDDEFYYNVDGKIDLNTPIADSEERDVFSREVRIELLVNRCFIRTTPPEYDLWPFNDMFRAKATL